MYGEILCLEGKENRSISPSGNQASDFCLFEQFFRESGGGEIFSSFLISTQYHCVGLSESLSDSILMFGVSRLSLLRSVYGASTGVLRTHKSLTEIAEPHLLNLFCNSFRIGECWSSLLEFIGRNGVLSLILWILMRCGRILLIYLYLSLIYTERCGANASRSSCADRRRWPCDPQNVGDTFVCWKYGVKYIHSFQPW